MAQAPNCIQAKAGTIGLSQSSFQVGNRTLSKPCHLIYRAATDKQPRVVKTLNENTWRLGGPVEVLPQRVYDWRRILGRDPVDPPKNIGFDQLRCR
ncbi:MAG: hypothetical protein VX936_11985, partial [Planctomycetota bacterium]|nr:hypothetical protein [Planctomycetota bacterium]